MGTLASTIDVGIIVAGNVSVASGVIVNVVQELIINGSFTLNKNSSLSTNATLHVTGTYHGSYQIKFVPELTDDPNIVTNSTLHLFDPKPSRSALIMMA